MSHLCDSTVASPATQRDNVLASKCDSMRIPPFPLPPFFNNGLLDWRSLKQDTLSGPILRDIAILSLRYPILGDTFGGR